MVDWLLAPWPWYVAGPLIGLMVPLLLLLGNKKFAISSTLRHLCAACLPGKIPFFQYNWRAEAWNLAFVGGILIGGFVFGFLLENPDPLVIVPETQIELVELGLESAGGIAPAEIFSWEALGTVRGWVFIVLGGFLVGFGTRYAGGCTSGHSIMGMSDLQWPSMVASACFFAGGILSTWFLLPYLLQI